MIAPCGHAAVAHLHAAVAHLHAAHHLAACDSPCSHDCSSSAVVFTCIAGIHAFCIRAMSVVTIAIVCLALFPLVGMRTPEVMLWCNLKDMGRDKKLQLLLVIEAVHVIARWRQSLIWLPCFLSWLTTVMARRSIYAGLRDMDWTPTSPPPSHM